MVAPLIAHLVLPYFLHANLGVNTSDWKYGPELIYDAKIESYGPSFYEISDPDDDYNVIELINIDKYLQYNTTMKLKCRPKTRWSVICHFDNPRMVISTFDDDGNETIEKDSLVHRAKYPPKPPDYFEYSKSAEVLFGEARRAYLASSSMPRRQRDFARIFIDALRLPKSFIDLSEGTTLLEERENSTAGINCLAFYRAELTKNNENAMRNCKKKPYSLVMKKPWSSSPMGESMIVIKDKDDFDTCRKVYDHFDREYSIKRLKSQTKMIFTKNNFTSSTLTDLSVIKLGENTKKTEAKMQETVSLQLEDILPATGPLPRIEIVTPFGVVGGRVYHSYNAKHLLFS